MAPNTHIERAQFRKSLDKRNNNGERPDEIYAKDAVLEYCRLNDIKVSEARPGEIVESTHPDYALYSNGERIAMLEVRQSGKGFVLDPKSERGVREREERDKEVMRNASMLEDLMRSWVAPNQKIWLIIPHFTALFSKKSIVKLNQKLKTVFHNNFKTDFKKIECAGETVSAKSILSDDYSPLILTYGPTLQSSSPTCDSSLMAQTTFIICQCIEEKNEKYRHVSLPKWLAIVNTHDLLTIDDYIAACAELKAMKSFTEHTFEKIFMVCVRYNKAYLLSL